ncbi:MAG: beta-propeller domain-containing protein [Mogibacterium sp.]|nr:beta-propeller domain-containing protein [Mogibacterium sp.]
MGTNMNKDHNSDLEYIRDRFRSDGIMAPDSLNEDRIMAMISGTEPSEAEQKTFVPAAPKKRRTLKKWAAAAACAVVALFGVTGVYRVLNAPPDTDLVNGELYTFRNQSEISRLVNSLSETTSFDTWGGHGDLILEDSEMAAEDSADSSEAGMSAKTASPGSNAVTDASQPDHSDTYLQVEEVDEADIVKTDGKYIYYVNDDAEVVILSAKDGETKRMSVIGSEGIENYIQDIFLKGDTLVTVGRIYDEDDGYAGVVTYDISDRKNPVLLSSYRQTGDVVSSRMVGDYVYLVTSDYVYKGGRTVPKVYTDGEYSDMDASDICCVPDPQKSTYVVLGAIDITSGAQGKCKTHAVFGASEDIYCNDHNLYSAAFEWDSDKQTSYTRIVRASLDGLNIRFNATARVRGAIKDQFSMDEKDGCLRIATTSQRDGMDVNNLFVLDESLKETGKLTGFARNESIKSVRYIGDKAYVITYEQIDPLFIIDLSDPSQPSIDGEVKIDGFSSLLIPAGEGRLLGIGYATGDNGYGGEYAAGLKLALFDISDPSEPKVLDSKEFQDMNSPAQSTHKALTVNTREGWYAIPYEVWHTIEPEESDVIIIEEGAEDAEVQSGNNAEVMMPSYESRFETGVLVFGAEDSLTVYDQHRLDSSSISRSVYIGDYIYALDAHGEVSSFRFTR